MGEAPANELHDLFSSLGPVPKGIYMATADMIRAEGRAQALVQQLTLKFRPLDPAVLDTVYTATSEPPRLEAWTARVLTADTLDEVLHP